jgi:hypothetical protein
MNPAVRFASFMLALFAASLAYAGNSVISVPAEMQHFGPLLVAATDEESPVPDTMRGDLFGNDMDGRIRLLRAFEVDTIPQLHELWAEFLRSHAGDEDRAITQSIGGALEEVNIGDPGSKQMILEADFDAATDLPFELRAVFDWKAGLWKHVATLACRCRMTDSGDPLNPRPGYPLLPQEYLVSIQRRPDNGEYHREEIRFRLRGGLLWPLIDFESMLMKCPQGASYGPSCSVVETSLEPTKLTANDGKVMQGFALVSRSGHPPPCDMCGLLLRNPKCSAYLWDENAFAYVPTQFESINCGLPERPPRSATASKRPTDGSGSNTSGQGKGPK